MCSIHIKAVENCKGKKVAAPPMAGNGRETNLQKKGKNR